MILLPKPLLFEWDNGNKDKNFIKHNVTMQEAEEVFSNEPFLVSNDTKHSQYEIRYQALGKTKKKRKLFLSFMIRDTKVRLISIRDMNKKEEVVYEKFEANS